MKTELTTYQIYLILLRYLSEYDDAEMLEPMLTELYRMAEKNSQKPVLDKIRAEIEEEYGDYDICEWFSDYDYEEDDISEYWYVGAVTDILKIIDKYKAESEGQGMAN